MRLIKLSSISRSYASSQYLPAKDIEAVTVSSFAEPPTFEVTFITRIQGLEQISTNVGYGEISQLLIGIIPEIAELTSKERENMIQRFIKDYSGKINDEIAKKLSLIYTSDIYQFNNNPDEYFGSVEIVDVSKVIVDAIVNTAVEVASKLAKKLKKQET